MNLLTSVGSPQVLKETLERLVQTRTGGMVRGLRVDVLDGEVILSGRTSTYYAKQLATHAALNAVDPITVTNAIEVH